MNQTLNIKMHNQTTSANYVPGSRREHILAIFLLTHLYCLAGCLSMIVWTHAGWDVLYACVCVCVCVLFCFVFVFVFLLVCLFVLFCFVLFLLHLFSVMEHASHGKAL